MMSLPRTLGELQLYRVLQRANLLSYYDTFIQQGGDDVQQLCEAGEEEFLEIMALVGMATKPLHVRRLQKALREWATNPALFNQPLASVPVNSIPLFKICDAPGHRKSVSNGHSSSSPGGGDHERPGSALTPQCSGSPKSPSSQSSQPDIQGSYRDRVQLSPLDLREHSGSWIGRHTPEPEVNSNHCTSSQPAEDDHAVTTPPLSSTPPAPMSYTLGVSARLEAETVKAVAESVERLMKTVPRTDPGEVKALLKLNKKLAKTVGHIFDMDHMDPAKEEEIRKYSLIYGRFDSKRREGKQLTHHELTINEASAQFCIRDNALLLRRVELFSLARQVARECAYTCTLKCSRLSTDEANGSAPKKIKQEVMVSECISSSHDPADGHVGGADGFNPGFRHGADEDSLSGESLDGHTQGLGSRSSLSSSPCPTAEPQLTLTGPPTWNRHLMQQTLMDEGLRLARLVSHDHVGKLSPNTVGGILPGELVERGADGCLRSSLPSRRSSSCSTKEEQDNDCK
ncbi:NGFI-A-binding protein 2 isoform X1 [Polypterus senegalus]|uniref:NGFI-A-binding protein 2 isoform X1 n=1 Tax=Polypterus senegalus TaxID=55291 RepID=UPI0019663EE9|nr:NGFI-A-binding protein 2 isoform X1 [Polypterus senegalus]